MPQTPDATEQALITLFSNASKGQIAPDSIVRLDKADPITMHANGSGPLRAVMLFGFEKNQPANSKEGIKLIQDALGQVPVIADRFNGLQQLASIKDQFNELKKANPATGGLSNDDITLIEQWRGVQSTEPVNQYMVHGFGPKVTEESNKPLVISFNHFTDAGAADNVRQNLQARIKDIRAKIIEMASSSSLLNDAQKAELNKLRIDVVELQDGNGSSVRLHIGIPNEAAPAPGPDGMLPLKGSQALGILTAHRKAPDAPSTGRNIVRYAVNFAGENWQEVFPSIAGSREVELLLRDRLKNTQNAEAKAAIEGFLAHDIFLPGNKRREKWQHPQTDFKISGPSEEYPNSYRVRLTLPEGMTKEQVYESIRTAAATMQQSQPAVDAATPAQETPAVAASAAEQSQPEKKDVAAAATGTMPREEEAPSVQPSMADMAAPLKPEIPKPADTAVGRLAQRQSQTPTAALSA